MSLGAVFCFLWKGDRKAFGLNDDLLFMRVEKINGNQKGLSLIRENFPSEWNLGLIEY